MRYLPTYWPACKRSWGAGVCNALCPYQPLVEIAQRGLNKGRVLADFAASLGIGPDEVAAFGDMPNDFEMLDWAGHGYVMASGLPELKDRVGRICPGFEEDGVAQIIERMLAERKGRQA